MLPLPHVDAALAELDRVFDAPGVVGVGLTTSVAGRALTDPAFAPVWQELDRRGTVIYLHPDGDGVAPPRRSPTTTMGANPDRLTTEASFAALCGGSPIEHSSGRRSTRRLNHGGDRQANAALHRIVFTRLRHDPRTQAYYERRTQEGKTRREIIRCLKRYAAREVFNLVRRVSRTPAL